MINQVKLIEQINYFIFREFLGNKIHPMLYDTFAGTDKKINYTKASYAWNNWSFIKDENDKMQYFLMHDSIFRSIIHEDLIEKASKNYPDYFGTNEPEKVLEALSHTIRITHDSSKKESYRQTSYVAVTNKQMNKVLYLGLFREIGDGKVVKEFSGGYLHCLKHFCGSDKQPITSHSEPYILPEKFIEHIIRSLFEGNHATEKDVEIPNDKYYTYKYLIDEKEYRFGFYYSAKFDIFFLSDARRKGK